MKKKFVVALVAAMSLTVAGTGTVFAMDKVSTIASEKEHVHGDNCEWVVDKEAWTENILKYKCVCNGCQAEFASDEEWAAHDKAAAMNGDFSHGSYTNVPYYETVEHPEEGHYETVVVKPSWTETVEHPEEGHWVCNGEPQEPEQKPENPDQKPEQPENPDVETPETPDAENQATPEQKPEANKENVQTQATETKKEGTSPKTGDTTSALPVAGAGLASLGVALATILKKRK